MKLARKHLNSFIKMRFTGENLIEQNIHSDDRYRFSSSQ
jgi:hypothetical protein